MPADHNESGQARTINLVLEGGGVKAVAHVGALTVLHERGFVINRVAGASAGAVVGALVAAGIAGEQLKELLLDFNFLDLQVPIWGRFLPRRFGKVLALLTTGAMYQMTNLRSWLDEQLSAQGVVTFGDLKSADGDKLTVAVTDLTRGEVVYLPRDYRRLYGRDPDAERVVDAICASAAFPFFFRPQTIESRPHDIAPVVRVPEPVSIVMDGGVMANYPIEVFDSCDGHRSSIPTIGIKLLPRLPRAAGDNTIVPTPQTHVLPLRLIEMMVGTLVAGRMQAQVDLETTSVRTVYVDTHCVDILHFALTDDDRSTLFNNGRTATIEFLKSWQ